MATAASAPSPSPPPPNPIMSPSPSSLTTKPPINPTIAPHLTPYLVPPTHYTNFFTIKSPSEPKSNSNSRLVASTITYTSSSTSSSSNNRILLLRRSLNSFQPHLWEIPGGRCESQDPTIIDSAIRELYEETGLVTKRVVDVVGEYEWVDCGRGWKKVVFLVDVLGISNGDGDGDDKVEALEVKLDPEEHDGFVWASEEDVRGGRCGGVEIFWTSDELRGLVLDAFRLIV